MKEVCFSQQSFNTYMFILLLIIIYITYILYTSKKEQLSNVNLDSHLSKDELETKVKDLQDKLYQSQLSEQKCQIDLLQTKNAMSGGSVGINQQNALLNKIYNPLVAPERIYPGGRLNTPGFDDYQMIGFVFKGNERYPLYGRYKYPGRSDRWEYYVIDETRNRLKIPFKSHNDNEIYDNDTISIPTLGDGYSVKIYDYEQFRYNPNVL